ncbi:MAG: hypothetical protein ACPG51_18740 [Thiolinea sp.]
MSDSTPPLPLNNKQITDILYRITCLVAALAECRDMNVPYAIEVLTDKLDEDIAYLHNYFEVLAAKEVQV